MSKEYKKRNKAERVSKFSGTVRPLRTHLSSFILKKDLSGFLRCVNDIGLDKHLEDRARHHVLYWAVRENLGCGIFSDSVVIKSVVEAKADLDYLPRMKIRRLDNLLVCCFHQENSNIERRLQTFGCLLVHGASVNTGDNLVRSLNTDLHSHYSSIEEADLAWDVLKREKPSMFTYPQVLEFYTKRYPVCFKPASKIPTDITQMVCGYLLVVFFLLLFFRSYTRTSISLIFVSGSRYSFAYEVYSLSVLIGRRVDCGRQGIPDEFLK